MDLAELHLPRSVAYVGLARLVVAAAARLAGLADERLEDLKIAVSEAAAHAVTAARGQGGALLLAFGPRRGAFEVQVLGGAVGYERAATDSLREWPDEGGMGLTLMEGLADEVVFPSDADSALVLRFAMAGSDRAMAAGSADGGAVAR